MNTYQKIEQFVKKVPAGQVFDYRSIPDYSASSVSVIRVVNRMVAENKLKRFTKGMFYVPKQGLLGDVKPSDQVVIRSILYKAGKRRGYVTGLALYNQLGLTTQVPSMIDIAIKGGKQIKDFGTLKIRTVIARAPVTEKSVPLLQYLDALKDIKKIPDSDVNTSLKVLNERISLLRKADKAVLADLGATYYGPQVLALMGLLLGRGEEKLKRQIKDALNPSTIFKLKVNDVEWPEAKNWNIH